jgi:excisionase family DNA binding protein
MEHESESRQAIRHAPTRGGMPSPLLTRPQAAMASGLTRRQIAALVDSGQLHAIMIGRRQLIPRAALDRLLQELHGLAA